MKKILLVVIVFFGALMLTHLFFVWGCRLIDVKVNPLVFIVDFIVGVVGALGVVIYLEDVEL